MKKCIILFLLFHSGVGLKKKRRPRGNFSREALKFLEDEATNVSHCYDSDAIETARKMHDKIGLAMLVSLQNNCAARPPIAKLRMPMPAFPPAPPKFPNLPLAFSSDYYEARRQQLARNPQPSRRQFIQNDDEPRPFYFEPTDNENKFYVGRLMQQTAYLAQDRMRVLSEIVKKHAGSVRYQVRYELLVAENLNKDIQSIWTRLRRQFIYTFGYTNYLMNWWRHYGAAGTNYVSKHLIYYTMAFKKFIDIVYIVEAVHSKYQNHLRFKQEHRMLLKGQFGRHRTMYDKYGNKITNDTRNKDWKK